MTGTGEHVDKLEAVALLPCPLSDDDERHCPGGKLSLIGLSDIPSARLSEERMMDPELTVEESPEGAFEHFLVGPSCWPTALRRTFYATLPISLPLYCVAWLLAYAILWAIYSR